MAKDKTIKCPSCDAENGEGSKHCSSCGAAIGKTPSDERETRFKELVAEGVMDGLGKFVEGKKQKKDDKSDKGFLEDIFP